MTHYDLGMASFPPQAPLMCRWGYGCHEFAFPDDAQYFSSGWSFVSVYALYLGFLYTGYMLRNEHLVVEFEATQHPLMTRLTRVARQSVKTAVCIVAAYTLLFCVFFAVVRMSATYAGVELADPSTALLGHAFLAGLVSCFSCELAHGCNAALMTQVPASWLNPGPGSVKTIVSEATSVRAIFPYSNIINISFPRSLSPPAPPPLSLCLALSLSLSLSL